MLDVKRLRVLREVANRGSFSGAADSLYLSQSAVSQQVATLEREVGMPLLDRTSSGPKLTQAGRILVEHADAVICRLEEAERELSAIAGLEGGEVRLASFPTASATVITQAVSEFGRRHPKVQVVLFEAEPEDSLPRLRAGELDLALTFDYPTLPEEPDRDIELIHLLTESMYVTLPQGHPLAKRDRVRLTDLADERWLTGVRPSSCGELVVQTCIDAGFEPQIAFESDDYHVLQGFVAAGLGVTLLPELALSTLRSDLVALPIEPEAPERRVWAATRAAGSRSAAAEAMIELLQVGAQRVSAAALRAVA
jgi:DNA-binding transcriptional LysR family regulator